MKNQISKYKPVQVSDYIPDVVQRLMQRITMESFPKIALYGFSENMKWLHRLLREQGKKPILCDWRKKLIGFYRFRLF